MNNTHPEEPRVLIIGDVHGKFGLLKELLEQEGIIKEGVRIKTGAEVVQLGDLGDFRQKTAMTDRQCYGATCDGWIDVVLWGNHDRAVRDQTHEFNGYHKPTEEVIHMMRSLEVDKRLKMAYAVHGYLLTHAGLHATFEHSRVPKGLDKNDPYDVADFLNQDPEKLGQVDLDNYINAVSRFRGGGHYWGGILWRDNRDELLYDKFPQIYGHTSSELVQENAGSYCIDTSKSGKISAIWLPDKKIVSVCDEK